MPRILSVCLASIIVFNPGLPAFASNEPVSNQATGLYQGTHDAYGTPIHSGIDAAKMREKAALSVEAAEQLLLAAVSREKLVAGPNSVAVQGELTNLFCFYVSQKQDKQALSVLDQILQFDLTTGETPAQSRTHSHCGSRRASRYSSASEIIAQIIKVAMETASNSRTEFARSILEKLLIAQKSALVFDDERFATTYKGLAEIDMLTGNFQSCEKNLTLSFQISKKYIGELQSLASSSNYIEVLKKVGKLAEADRLKSLQSDPSADKLLATASPDTVADMSSESHEVAFNAAVREYNQASAQAEYGPRAASAVYRVLSTARTLHDNVAIAKYMAVQYEIDLHTGRINSQQRVKACDDVVLAYLMADDKKNAAEWLKKSLQHRSEPGNFNDYLGIAKAYLALGDNVSVEAQLLKAEASIGNFRKSIASLIELANLWKAVGQTERASKLLAKVDILQAKSIERGLKDANDEREK